MAIVKMKKLRLFVATPQRKKLLRELMLLGCVEVCEPPTPEEGETTLLRRTETPDLVQLRTDQTAFTNCIALLKKYAPEKGGLLKPLPETRFLLPEYPYLLQCGFQRDGLAVRELEIPEYPRVAAVEHRIKLALGGVRHRSDLHLDRLAGVAPTFPALGKLEYLHAVIEVFIDRDVEQLLVRRDVDNIESAP